MQKNILNIRTAVIALIVTSVALTVFGFQQAQAVFKKAVAQGESIRVSEANSCSTTEDSDTPHFSGCNSII